MNRKAVLAVGGAIVAAGAYCAAAWYLGQRVEQALEEQHALMAKSSAGVKVVGREFTRGLLTSSDLTRYEIAAGVLGDEVVSFAVRSRIVHGPIIGLRLPGAAVVKSELELEGGDAKLREVLGVEKLPVLTTRFGFAGGGESDIADVDLRMTVPMKTGETLQMAIDKIKLHVEFGPKMATYSTVASIDRIGLKDTAGMEMNFKGMRVTALSERLVDPEAMLYAGWANADLDEVSVQKEGQPPAVLQKLNYRFEMPLQGEYSDITLKMSAQGVKAGNSDYGPAYFDMAFAHLKTDVVIALFRNFRAMAADPAKLESEAAGEVLEGLMTPLKELLAQKPVLRIDRLEFRTAEGVSRASGSLKLGELPPEMLANPLMWVSAMEAEADVSVPEAMVANALVSRVGAQAGPDADPKALGEMAKAQVAAFVEQGYLKRDGQALTARIGYSQAGITLNGKPFGGQ